jgi:hypothetical protein
MSRVWIGGGNNQASNPMDWSPQGAPQPSDGSLQVIASAGSPQPATMNIRGNDLAGVPLTVYGDTLTANLSHRAVVSSGVGGYGGGGNAVFNVSQRSELAVVTNRGSATVNLSQNSNLNADAEYGSGITANISGNDTFHAIIGSPFGTFTANLDQGARLSGTFSGRGSSSLTINGGARSTLDNNGDSFAAQRTRLNVDVSGSGTITTFHASGEVLEFVKSVGPHQSVFADNLVKVDQPNQFAANITLASPQNPPAGSAATSGIDLSGLANADSYTFKNDMLNIWSGNKIIDTLRLHNSTTYGFDVVQTSGSVNVVALTSPDQVLPGALPIHVGA